MTDRRIADLLYRAKPVEEFEAISAMHPVFRVDGHSPDAR